MISALRRIWPAVPATAIFVLLFVAPLSFLFVVSFWKKSLFQVVPDFSFDAYGQALVDYWATGLNTLAIGLATAVVTSVIAFLFAYVIRFRVGRWGDALLLITLLTLFGGYLVKVYAWKTILGVSGILNTVLLGSGLISEPLTIFIYNRGAVVVALVHFLLPLAVLPIYASMRNIKDITLEAARDFGAGPLQIMFGIVLPQCRAGVVAALAFTFLIAAGDYVTPLFLGGTTGTMIGMFIANQFSVRFDWPLGSAISFLIMIASLLIVSAMRLCAGRSFR